MDALAAQQQQDMVERPQFTATNQQPQQTLPNYAKVSHPLFERDHEQALDRDAMKDRNYRTQLAEQDERQKQQAVEAKAQQAAIEQQQKEQLAQHNELVDSYGDRTGRKTRQNQATGKLEFVQSDEEWARSEQEKRDARKLELGEQRAAEEEEAREKAKEEQGKKHQATIDAIDYEKTEALNQLRANEAVKPYLGVEGRPTTASFKAIEEELKLAEESLLPDGEHAVIAHIEATLKGEGRKREALKKFG